MKINARLLLLTFTIVVIVTVSSTIVYFSLTNKIISAQENQRILNATNDFIFNFQVVVEEVEADYQKIRNSESGITNASLQSENLDFIFTLVDDSQIDFENYVGSSNLNLRSKNLSLVQFLTDNPNLILKYDVREDNTYYYGKVISEKLLNEISEKIRANISLVVNNIPFELANSGTTQIYLPAVIDAIQQLRFKNQFDIYRNTYDSYDFYATYYSPTNLLTKDTKIGFIIFNPPKDVLEFRYNTGMIAIIITSAGIALALVLVLLFTSKLRVQISNLSYASEIIGQGNLDYRVPVDSKDELGKLGKAFNKMLNDLKSQKEAEKEYTEFITLLNQKPSLHEISDAAIQKIVKATGISFGVIYLIESNNNLRKIASYGLSEGVSASNNFDFYRNAIEQKDVIEFKFKKNLPVIKTGLTEIRIKYTIIMPIIYGNDVVAVAELASEEIPEKDVKAYLLNIREQLAIGIINGTSFEKLEKFVEDLKKLNIEYEDQNKELRELHHELKIKADELNLERIKALESTKLKSQFLTNITHELKTPLNSIIGLSDLIYKDSLLSESHKNKLTVIIRNGKKLLNLINNILEFSKAEAGKTIIKKETFTLSHFVDEINSFIQPIASEKGLNYVCTAPEDTSVVLNTDKTKLEQIIINLLNNAIKFTDKGIIELRIHIESDKTLIIEVIDSGIGIDEKDREIIFEEFRQADGSISRQHDGTGLGLSICKRFTELLNGHFHLDSELNKGSKFTIIIPDVILKKGSFKDSASKQYAKSKRIIILEEDKSNRKIFSDYLVLNDYHTFEYDGITDLVEFINERTINNIIINQNYKNGKGWSIVDRIKNNSELNHITPIVVNVHLEKNYGYGLAVYDYISSTDYKIQSDEVLKILSSEMTNQNYNLSIMVLSKEAGVKEHLRKKPLVTLSNQKDFTKLISQRNLTDLPDVVFIDINSKSLEIIDIVKHDRSTRKIKFVGILPRDIEAEEKLIVNKLKELTINRKHHVIDVLKILRDRLHIAENELARAKLLVDESPQSQGKISELKETGQIKILIVDDDRDTLYTVGEIVKSSGYHAMYAKNGIECILTLKHEYPDLILLDIMMPKMDGFETLKEIRKNKDYDNIPVVALTAYAMLDDKDIIDKSGFQEIITKPIDTLTITSKLKELLKYKVKNS